MKLEKVTITGADDSIKPEELLVLSKKFPFVEWAILLSKSQTGYNRFPSQQWMIELNDVLNKNLSQSVSLAGHLCGSWLRTNLMGYGQIGFISEIPLWSKFQRIQLNFHAEKHELNERALATLRKESWDYKKTFIIQMDGVNNSLYSELSFAGVKVQPFFDISHGAGVLPDSWPATIPGTESSDSDAVPSLTPNPYRGYAGGLSPDNLEEQLNKLAATISPSDTIWVDMETRVRSNNDNQFDLDKVTKCLEIAERFIAGV